MTKEGQSPLTGGGTQEYITALLEFLGDREPLAVFEETGAKLLTLTGGLSDRQLRIPEKPGKWCVLDVVWHLADVEIVLGLRYRTTVAEPGSTVAAFNQDAWVKELGYRSRSLRDALEDFARVRQVNLRFLKGLPSASFARFAVHQERGKETLEDMLRLYAAHDLYHLYQIDRIKTAIGA